MNQQSNAAAWRFSDVELDERARELTVRGRLVEIEPKSFEVLLVLLQRAGEVVTIEEFQDAVWPGRIVAESAVTNIVSKLRRALEDENQDIIKTVPKVGYRLAVAVERVAGRRAEPTVPTLKAGDAIPGREQWRLAEALTGGGYGDVWLAEHAKTREKRVFKFCVDSERLSALKREVTLNRLLQDALGSTDRYVRILEWNFEAPPFFIESAYAGLNLAEWIKSKGGAAGIPLAERIEVVAVIADALGAAHSVAVLHKDLKPENVLIDEQRGQLCVRLADFGAGRLLDSSRLAELGITRLGFTQSAALDDSTTGTLLYMAPELLSGGSPSVQSDIYSLGVLLYQLVADKLGKPMAPGWEGDIEDPLLRQDIIEATHGDRERRLPSSLLLAEHLRALPQRRAEQERIRKEREVAADALRVWERSRARRPWLLAAMAILIVGLGTTSYFFVRERQQTQQALEQARIAQSLNDFVNKDILQAVDPNHGGTADVTLKEAVKRAVPEVAKRFANQPLTEASVDSALAQALFGLDDYETALSMDQRTTAIYTEHYGPFDPRTLRARSSLVSDLMNLGKEKEATSLIDEILASWSRNGSLTHPDYFRARLEKLVVMSEGGSVPAADSITFARTLLNDARAADMDADFIYQVEFRLVEALEGSGQTAEAEKLARASIPELQRSFGRDASQTLHMRMSVAELEAYHHEADVAEADLKELRTSLAKRYGADSMMGLAPLEDLGIYYQDLGRWPEAVAMFRENLEGTQRTFGPNNGSTVSPRARYIWALAHAGQAAEASSLALNNLELARKELTTDESFILSYCQLVTIYTLVASGQSDKAAALTANLDSTVSKLPASDFESRGYLLLAKGYVARQRGDVAGARANASGAVEMLKKVDRPDGYLSMKSMRELLDSLPPG